jgi:RNA-binding protein NOB1
MSDARATPPAEAPAAAVEASASTVEAPAAPAPLSAAGVQAPRIDTLILDAGPLLTRAALTHLASTFLIPPLVLAELRDPAARAHLEALQRYGADVRVVDPGAKAMQHVAAFARQTGDLPVLSQPDLSVLALTYKVEQEKHGDWRIRAKVGGPVSGARAWLPQLRCTTDGGASQTGQQAHEAARLAAVKADGGAEKAKPASAKKLAPASAATALSAQVSDLSLAGPSSSRAPSPAPAVSAAEDDDEGEWITPRPAKRVEPIAEPEDAGGSDGEGEWITSANISSHKARDLGLITAADEAPSVASPAVVAPEAQQTRTKGKKGKGKARMTVACMTGDYAVQNVLLQMNLALVSIEGARIEKVKSWVLRCHACMK